MNVPTVHSAVIRITLIAPMTAAPPNTMPGVMTSLPPPEPDALPSWPNRSLRVLKTPSPERTPNRIPSATIQMKNSAIDSTSEILNADQMSMCRSCRRARRGPRPAALRPGRPPCAFFAAGAEPVRAGPAPVPGPAACPGPCARIAPVPGMACVVETEAGTGSPAAVSCVRTDLCESLIPISRSPAAVAVRSLLDRPGRREVRRPGAVQLRGWTGRGPPVAGYDGWPDPRLSSGITLGCGLVIVRRPRDCHDGHVLWQVHELDTHGGAVLVVP